MTRIAEIKDNDVANGKGITMSVWFQGCPHRCKGCHNESTWDYFEGRPFTYQDIIYILENIDKDGIQRDLAVLGGEPLCPQNISGCMHLCRVFKHKYPNKKIYLWTGYTFEQLMQIYGSEVVKDIDILIDGRYVEKSKDLNLELRGSSNQRIIDVKEMVKKYEKNERRMRELYEKWKYN